ncbi:hypothetical protein LP418_27105 [Nocardioides sp. B-3]|nr:MaoC/PaaZ C-terminal domain-containing protein [Nocardioides sp. B-3]UUZ59421.1 hypothetical protein LP418_27105 [Nocardioides sp. B-3]
MIDPVAVGAAEPSTHQISWTTRDVLLYQLSLGASDLSSTYERGLRVLPTFAMVAGQGMSAGDRPARGLDLPGIEIDLRKILHSGRALSVSRPIPACGTATVTSHVAEVWDKGKAAVVVLETSAADDDGPLWTSRMQIWARGEGGFGGSPGPAEARAAPDRDPDFVLDSPTASDRALLYRLNGDLNPLHVDPEFAQQVGFERPILHGLASYGIVAKSPGRRRPRRRSCTSRRPRRPLCRHALPGGDDPDVGMARGQPPHARRDLPRARRRARPQPRLRGGHPHDARAHRRTEQQGRRRRRRRCATRHRDAAARRRQQCRRDERRSPTGSTPSPTTSRTTRRPCSNARSTCGAARACRATTR